MKSDVLLVGDENRVRTLTLNRPKQLNAFNDDLYDACAAALLEAASHSHIGAVIITGEGRAFSAGQDLGELASPPTHTDGKRHGFGMFMSALESFPKPLIAAVNGIGVGIGLTMLPYCDIVMMSADARLRAPFVSLGVTAEAGSTYLLPATIGWANTAHLLYTASWVDAEEAVRIGLARTVVNPQELMRETRALAERIASMPVSSLVATKKLLVDARMDAVHAARTREEGVFGGLVGGPANVEALLAFQEKREADFSKL